MRKTWVREECGGLSGNGMRKGVVWGKNKPSLFLVNFSQSHCIGVLPSSRGGLGSLELAELSVTPFLSLTHCATLGKLYGISEPQMHL